MIVGDAGLVGLMPAGSVFCSGGLMSHGQPQIIEPSHPTRWLRGHFGSYSEPVGALLAAISDDATTFFPHVVHDVRERWGSGRRRC
jgi:hypothetical protein